LAKLFFKKVLKDGFYGLVPSDSHTKMVFGRVKMGKIVRMTLNVARNYEFHKKAMALTKVGFDNQAHYSDFDMFRKWVTIKCGYVNFISIEGVAHPMPKSWAFDKMSNDEFAVFYKILWGVIYNDVMRGVESMELEAAVLAEVREFMND